MNTNEFIDRLSALITVVEKRLPRSLGALIHEYHQEEALSLDSFTWALVHDQIPVTRGERDELRALLEGFELPVPSMRPINDRDNVIASLNVLDEPAQDQGDFYYYGPLVTVQEDPDFTRALGAQVGVHVGLPDDLQAQFIDDSTTNVGVGSAVNLVRTNPHRYIRAGSVQVPSIEEVLFASELVWLIASTSVWGGGVLLRNFGQWAKRDRIEADSLVSDLPRLILGAGPRTRRSMLCSPTSPNPQWIVWLLCWPTRGQTSRLRRRQSKPSRTRSPRLPPRGQPVESAQGCCEAFGFASQTP
ncbi:hypothetical protein ABT324_13780 [Saccharopolyspora sp. NPDC000359]|uniref:hypothetical protein n=1 Tax=Saccharopolyspora sp. NPDC000359 TaxID=3154251 RepID=UPI003327114F